MILIMGVMALKVGQYFNRYLIQQRYLFTAKFAARVAVSQNQLSMITAGTRSSRYRSHRKFYKKYNQKVLLDMQICHIVILTRKKTNSAFQMQEIIQK